MTTANTEIERKYSVAEVVALPDLAASGLRAGPVLSHLLQAVYLDTDDLRLTTARVTLRRRTGGGDEGWHVKLPAAGDARREVHAALEEGVAPSRADGELDLAAVWQVPSTLREVVAAVVGEAALRPVAVLANRRDVTEVFDAGHDGPALAEICDDHVTATSIDPATGETEQSKWREWEVELLGGGVEVFDRLEPVLLAAGATPSDSPSKLARALQPVLARRRP